MKLTMTTDSHSSSSLHMMAICSSCNAPLQVLTSITKVPANVPLRSGQGHSIDPNVNGLQGILIQGRGCCHIENQGSWGCHA